MSEEIGNETMFEASISGLHAAGLRMAASAHNIANMNTPDAQAHRVVQRDRPNLGGVDAWETRTDRPPDLVEDIVDQRIARHAMSANAAVLRSQDQAYGTIIDLLA